MRVTTKQAYVLANLHRIVFTQDYRKQRATLDGEDCRLQLVALGAKHLVRWNGNGRPTKIADPEGITGCLGRVGTPARRGRGEEHRGAEA